MFNFGSLHVHRLNSASVNQYPAIKPGVYLDNQTNRTISTSLPPQTTYETTNSERPHTSSLISYIQREIKRIILQIKAIPGQEGFDLEFGQKIKSHVCKYCSMVFPKAQGLGGHTSKMHKEEKAEENTIKMDLEYNNQPRQRIQLKEEELIEEEKPQKLKKTVRFEAEDQIWNWQSNGERESHQAKTNRSKTILKAKGKGKQNSTARQRHRNATKTQQRRQLDHFETTFASSQQKEPVFFQDEQEQ